MPSRSHKLLFPKPADAEAAARLRADFSDLGEAERLFAASRDGVALLDALGGNAPYLAELACLDSAALLACMASGPDAHVAALLHSVRELPPGLSRRELGAALRRAKRQAALAIAVADIGGLWPLEKITGALSDLAEATLRAAVRHLLFTLHEGGQITLPFPEDPERGSGFTALALG
ncbi:MAG: glutamate-ammonia-ligase adenylyltransferase, partial [Acidocella sp.]